MNVIRSLAIVVALGSLFAPATMSFANEKHVSKPVKKKDNGYIDELIRAILDKTDAPGAAERRVSKKTKISRDRMLLELIAGERIEYSAKPTKPEWEEKLITIRIPLRKGLQGYRLFFVNKEDEPLLGNISSIDDLRKLPTGAGTQWSTTALLEETGFKVVRGDSKEGLLKMLEAKRFKTFGRGIDEIFFEQEKWGGAHPNLMIDQHIALYIPYPTYLFVSPERPDLAARFQKGLELMIADGSFDQLFWKHFEDDIARANLKNRKILRIANPDMPDVNGVDQKDLSFTPGDVPPKNSQLLPLNELLEKPRAALRLTKDGSPAGLSFLTFK